MKLQLISISVPLNVDIGVWYFSEFLTASLIVSPSCSYHSRARQVLVQSREHSPSSRGNWTSRKQRRKKNIHTVEMLFLWPHRQFSINTSALQTRKKFTVRRTLLSREEPTLPPSCRSLIGWSKYVYWEFDTLVFHGGAGTAHWRDRPIIREATYIHISLSSAEPASPRPTKETFLGDPAGIAYERSVPIRLLLYSRHSFDKLAAWLSQFWSSLTAFHVSTSP